MAVFPGGWRGCVWSGERSRPKAACGRTRGSSLDSPTAQTSVCVCRHGKRLCWKLFHGSDCLSTMCGLGLAQRGCDGGSTVGSVMVTGRACRWQDAISHAMNFSRPVGRSVTLRGSPRHRACGPLPFGLFRRSSWAGPGFVPVVQASQIPVLTGLVGGRVDKQPFTVVAVPSTLGAPVKSVRLQHLVALVRPAYRVGSRCVWVGRHGVVAGGDRRRAAQSG